MKKKLLITLGCSYTEGNGCYGDLETPSELTLKPLSDLFSKKDLETLPYRFHKNGWPLRLAKKMGYDKLINMGIAGSSTSGQLKRYFEIYYHEKFEDYDVTIFWLMTQPSRFSFYKNGLVTDMICHMSDESLAKYVDSSGLPGEYIRFIEDVDIDPILEQIFYIKSMEQHCENRNYNLLVAHHDLLSDALLKYYHPSKYNLSKTPTSVFSMLTEHDYSFCNHPNENGYEKISEFMLSEIKRNHSEILNPTPSESISWQWSGDLFQWHMLNSEIKSKLVRGIIKQYDL